jgi:hypothetical protein
MMISYSSKKRAEAGIFSFSGFLASFGGGSFIAHLEKINDAPRHRYSVSLLHFAVLSAPLAQMG